MSLTFEGRQIDAGDAADWNIIERQVPHYSDLRRPVVTFDGAQVRAAAVDLHAELGASPRVGEFDANMTACDRLLQRLPRFFPQPRFDRMIAFAEKLYQLAHSTPPRRLQWRPCALPLAPVGVIRAPRSTHLDLAPLCVLDRTDFHGEEFATGMAQAARVPAGSPAPPRFVMRSPLQFPRSAAAPSQRPRNADRSGSYANTVCGSTLAKSKPSSPHRRERLQDRSKQPQGSCRADQANLLGCYIAAKAPTMPSPRAKTDVIARGRKPKNAEETR